MTDTCKTCQFWRLAKEDHGFDDYDTVGRLSNRSDHPSIPILEQRWEYTDEAEYFGMIDHLNVRVCQAPGMKFYEMPAAGEAAILDGSEYRGTLVTHADFGCTLHAAPETPR